MNPPLDQHFDVRTALVIWLLVQFSFGVLELIMASTRRDTPLLLMTSLSALITGVSTLLLALRGLIPDALSIGVANGLYWLGLSMLWTGMRLFSRRPVHLWLIWLPALAIALAFTFVPAIAGDFRIRVQISCYSLALITIVTALDLIGDQRREPLVARRIVLLAVLVSTFALLGQGVLASVVGPSATSLQGVPRVQQASAILLVVVTMLWHIGLLLMISERLQNRLLLLAERDGLTGVLNRAGFERLGQRQVERCHRSGSASTVLMMDLDYFKQVNDRYGHDIGDQMLRLFVQTVRGLLRPGDLFGRYGGEEFCVLLPATVAADAVVIGERLRECFERVSLPVDQERSLSTTVTIGVYTVPGHDRSLASAMKIADAALYVGKRRGRNCVVLA